MYIYTHNRGMSSSRIRACAFKIENSHNKFYIINSCNVCVICAIVCCCATEALALKPAYYIVSMSAFIWWGLWMSRVAHCFDRKAQLARVSFCYYIWMTTNKTHRVLVALKRAKILLNSLWMYPNKPRTPYMQSGCHWHFYNQHTF